MELDRNTSVEHQNVPTEHRGLHDFLYSSQDEHTAVEIATRELVSNGSEILPIATWCDRAANAKVAGVYAVLDSERRTQYVGISRNVLLSLNGHIAQLGKETCSFVRVQAFKFPKRTEMENLRDTWIAEVGSIPPGNDGDGNMWAETIGAVARAVMSAEERNIYEEKKLKIRKAMADAALAKEVEMMDMSETERHQRLEAAVKNDDWSAVVSESQG